VELLGDTGDDAQARVPAPRSPVAEAVGRVAPPRRSGGTVPDRPPRDPRPHRRGATGGWPGCATRRHPSRTGRRSPGTSRPTARPRRPARPRRVRPRPRRPARRPRTAPSSAAPGGGTAAARVLRASGSTYAHRGTSPIRSTGGRRAHIVPGGAAASRRMYMVAENVCFMPPDSMVRHIAGMYWAFGASSGSCMRLTFSSALPSGPRVLLVPWCPVQPAGGGTPLPLARRPLTVTASAGWRPYRRSRRRR
jgi:hypothetical protein